VEREIGDDAERLGRQLGRSRIRLPHLDVRPTPGEPLSEARIELDRDHPTGRSRELGGQPSGAGTQVDHERVGPKGGVTDELGREPPSKEVLTRSAPRAARSPGALLGHGPSPRTWSSGFDPSHDQGSSAQ